MLLTLSGVCVEGRRLCTFAVALNHFKILNVCEFCSRRLQAKLINRKRTNKLYSIENIWQFGRCHCRQQDKPLAPKLWSKAGNWFPLSTWVCVTQDQGNLLPSRPQNIRCHILFVRPAQKHYMSHLQS